MRLSWTRRYQIKQAFLELTRLAVAVGCSVAVTLYMTERPKAPARVKTAAARPAVQDTWNEELGDFYSEYLGEVLRALRANPKVRMARMDLPQTVLTYQRNVATLEQGGSAYRLQARGKTIPVIAVSRNAKSFLEEMRVTYIDPEALPKRNGFGLSESAAKQYLFIPDVSGTNMKKFAFGPR